MKIRKQMLQDSSYLGQKEVVERKKNCGQLTGFFSRNQQFFTTRIDNAAFTSG